VVALWSCRANRILKELIAIVNVRPYRSSFAWLSREGADDF
jgi:hypothetical protein